MGSRAAGAVKHYLARRVGSLLFVLLGVTTLTFALGRLAPGDPAELVLERALGRPPSDAQIARMHEQMGLDRPFAVQYVAWLNGAAHGDLGRSWGSGDAVASLLIECLPRTLLLAVSALLIAVGVAVPLGTLAAARPGSWVDHLSRVVAVCGTSMPAFFFGYVLMFVFGVRLHLLPIFGYGTARHLVLPAITLALGAAGALTRVTRTSVADVLAEPFMQSALARGIPRRRALWRHGLRVALLPLATVVGLAAGHLLGGAMIVEWMFSWPGIGKLGLDAIYNRDYPLIQGVVLLSATVFTLLNFGVDLVYLRIDPRVRLHMGER